MKNSIKYIAALSLTALLSVLMHSISFAQHRGGGGGGGFHSSGGGSFGGRAGGGSFGGGGFSGRSNGGFSNRSSAGSNGGYHSSFQGRSQMQQSHPQINNQRAYSSPQRNYSGGGSSRGVYSTSPRVGYNGAVRSYPGRAYGGNSGYRNGYYRGGYRNFYGGYYNRYYAPRLGFHINVLPYGYYPFYFGDYQYYYNNGLYYQQTDNSQYEVVAPPMGAIVPTVPNDAKSITIDGIQYYELDGVYYQPVTTSDGTTGYKIVGKDGELNTDQGQDQGQPQDQNNNYPPDNSNPNQ